MSYTPSFKTNKAAFISNNPTEADRVSLPVVISDLKVDAVRGAILVRCSDQRTRTCLYSRLTNEKMIKSLEKSLQNAYDKGTPLQFVAAGGNDTNQWFYKVI